MYGVFSLVVIRRVLDFDDEHNSPSWVLERSQAPQSNQTGRIHDNFSKHLSECFWWLQFVERPIIMWLDFLTLSFNLRELREEEDEEEEENKHVS